MIRIFIFTSIFFILELNFITNYLNILSQKNMWQINFKDDSQRRVFKVIQNILNAEYNSVFVFGGSASREFFLSDKYMTYTLGINFYNCAVSSQTPYESLKLQSIIQSNNIIIYGLHIKSLYDSSFDKQQIIDGYYFGGQYYKYPIIYDNLFKYDNNISFLNKLSPILNTYIYLWKEYKKEHRYIDMYNSILNIKLPKQYYYVKPAVSYNTLNSKLDKYFAKSQKGMKDRLLLNFSLIEKMIIQANKNENKFVLYELPFSPIIQERFKPYFKEYYKHLNILLKKYPDVIFISNKDFPFAKQKYFYDTIHLLPSGREYYKNSIIQNVKKVISDVK